MSFSCFVKLFAAAIAASLVGFFAVKAIGTGGLPAESLFATGITIGTLFGGLLVVLYPASQSGSKNASGTSSIYVGNLPFNAGESDVKNLFAPYGEVIEVRLVKDRRSRRPKGYGFVEMDAADAKSAIKHLNGTDYAGRTLRVNEGKKKGED
jgi:RNA recognition motif-containing protein